MIYDVLVIGGGPAGYHAAEYAGKLHLSCVLFEKDQLGGVCLNSGCIPTKTLLASAKRFEHARASQKYGVTVENAGFDHAVASNRKDRIVRMLQSGIAARLKESGTLLERTPATICGRTESGFEVEAGGVRYTGRNLLLATGSSAVLPPIPGLPEALASGIALTNVEMLSLKSVPASLLVLGGGVIGLEMASYFHSAGSEVTVVEMLDRVGGALDSEISEALRKSYEKRGVKFLLGTRAIEINGGRVAVENDAGMQSLTAEKLLISVGRRPNLGSCNLDVLGVAVERGAVAVDASMQTSVPHVYAVGDLNGHSMLAHTASREAEVAVAAIAGRTETIDYGAIPSVVYTDPEVFQVGRLGGTDASLREVRLPLRFSGRYIAENEGGNGFLKLACDADKRICGAAMIGNPASEIAPLLVLAVQQRLPIAELAKLVFPHPTAGEVFREAASALDA